MKQAVVTTVVFVGVAVALFVWLGSDGEDGVSSTPATGNIGTAVGDSAPGFTVIDSDDKRRALADYRGKTLVVTSTATWCPTCVVEAKQFTPVYREFRDKNVEFLSVSIDPSEDDQKIAQFKTNYDTPWPYTHPGRTGVREMIVDYKLVRFEITYIIDSVGVIRFKDTGITSTEKLREVLQAVVLGTQKEEIGETYEVQGQDHIGTDEAHPQYNSNPPTSGWHYELPVEWGVYEEELPDEQLVHNLEHGGIWISHKAFIPQEDIEALRALGREYTAKVIVTVRETNDVQVAVAAWGRLLELEYADTETIRKFIELYKNKGPEFVPDISEL